jgi:hypothetical protein
MAPITKSTGVLVPARYCVSNWRGAGRRRYDAGAEEGTITFYRTGTHSDLF